MHQQFIGKLLKEIAEAVGVRKDIRVSPHTCRHTFAHLQLKNGLDLYMYLKDAMNEYAFDCRIRKLSPRTLDNYTKQFRYFEEYLLENYGIDHIEEVKRVHIKHFMGMMDAKNRKPQYINDLLKVIKTFFRYI